MTDHADRPGEGRRPWVGGLKAVVGSVLATLAVRSVALATLDIPAEFPPLAGPGPTVFLTTVSALVAIGVFEGVRRSANRPKRVFRRIAAGVLLVSFVPDLSLLSDGATAAFPGATPAGVATLMLMHVVAALVIVWSLTAREPA